MSPLAKKKLLAQVSEAESLRCHKRHCPEGRWAPSDATLEKRSPEPSGTQDTAPSVGSEVGASPGGTDTQGCPRAEDRAPVPTVFTGYFHACRSEGLPPGASHPLWGYFSSLKDFLEPPPAFPARPEEPEQPQDLRSKAWESRGAAVQQEEEEDEEDEDEEEPFGPKLGAVSPFRRGPEGRDRGCNPPRGHRGLPKPRPVVAAPGFSALRFPAGFGSPLEHPEPRGVPVGPALSAGPLVIPAFPSPLVVGAELCQPPGIAPYGNPLRHRPYPWHGHPSHGSHHPPPFHRHAKL
ncbi:ARI5A protein, partial [Scytalopus superciliaris]|nr:ARI5A protein [Scytalopus superciliaris]